jgi:6-phosphogluconolactonase
MKRVIMAAFIVVALLMSSAVAALAKDQGETVKAGAVYTMTNAADGNQVVFFERGADGLLTLVAAVPTNGLGSGAGPDRGGLDSLESQGSIVLTEDNRWLLAVNAGSNEISVFRIGWDGPVLVNKVGSGGEFPVSVTVFHGLVYVLNAGGTPNITGFYMADQGQLIFLSNSTRNLGSGGFAQVGFDPHGDNLVVTDRDENEILVFPLDSNGRPATQPVTSMSSGDGPFGFTFDERGHLLVSEAGSSAASSYAINHDGSLQVISPSVENGQGAACWIARNRRGYVFTANTGGQNLSVYEEQKSNGQLDLIDATAAFGNRPIDMGVSVNGRFLYALDPASETIDMFEIESDGTLTDLGTVAGGLSIFAQGIAVR